MVINTQDRPDVLSVMVDGAQVALLDPAGDGHTVLDAIRRASRGLLGW